MNPLVVLWCSINAVPMSRINTQMYYANTTAMNTVNTLMSGLIQAVRKKTAYSHVTLRRNIFVPVQVTDLGEA